VGELGWAWLRVLGGVAALAVGGSWLVGGATALATIARVSPLVIGLTVVGFGTSSPEFAVTASASLKGNGDIAVGNVVGSNIANVLLILAASALLAPLTIPSLVLRRDLPVMIAAALAGWACAYLGKIQPWHGATMFLCLCAYLWWAIRSSKAEPAPSVEAPSSRPSTLWAAIMAAAGLAILVVGADQLVVGSSTIARGFGVGELIIGLTIVAIGTSLPELAASIAATAKGQRDIAVGNVVGSNIFNVLGVLGASAAVAPTPIAVADSAVRLDIPIMVGVSLLCIPIFASGKMGRWVGLGLLSLYSIYIALLASRSTAASG
jgi:cation:H+ antiporter